MEAPCREHIAERLNAAATAADFELVLRDVFVSERDAREWWTRPHPMLDGDAPVLALTRPDGVKAVRRVLLGLLHGFPV